MFKLYTKHTMEVNETVFEHLMFTVGVASRMMISSFCLLLHGLTGGLYVMPDRYNLCAMAEALCDANEDRETKKEDTEGETK